MWSRIMRKRSVWAKLPHTTFVVRARNYVTQRAENWNRFNSSPRPRFGSDYGALPWLQTADQRSGQRPDRYRTVAPRGNGRPTSAARCRPKGATWRLYDRVVARRNPPSSYDWGPAKFGRLCPTSLPAVKLIEMPTLCSQRSGPALPQLAAYLSSVVVQTRSR